MRITFEDLTVEQANELLVLAKKWETLGDVPNVQPMPGRKLCFYCGVDHGSIACPKMIVYGEGMR
jgi:hypothetical protein